MLAVLLASLGCWAALARLGDPRAASTAGWVAGLLPLGGGVAAVAGMVTAATQHFSVRVETFVAVGVVVLAVLAGTVVLARLLAVRLVRREDPTG